MRKIIALMFVIFLPCNAFAEPDQLWREPKAWQSDRELLSFYHKASQAYFKGEDPDFYRTAATAWTLLRRNELERSRQILTQLAARSRAPANPSKIAGLISATYFGEGRHTEGLEFICSLYRREPQGSYRYRSAIHAHVRRIALQDGFARAELVVDRLAAACGRPDFSRVWIGIPIEGMWLLERSKTFVGEDFSLSKDDKAYLEEHVSRYPNDAFNDHAHYFLGNFRHVVNAFPRSLIRDTAMAALAQSTKDKRVALSVWNDYLTEYSGAPGAPCALAYIHKTLMEMGELREANKFWGRCDLEVSAIAREPLDIESVRNEFYLVFPYTEDTHLIVQKYLGRHEGRGVAMLQEGRFLDYFAMLESVRDAISRQGFPIPIVLTRRIKFAKMVVDTIESKDFKRIFRLGLHVRDYGDMRKYRSINYTQDDILDIITFRDGVNRAATIYDTGVEISFHKISSEIFRHLLNLQPPKELSARAAYIIASNARKNVSLGSEVRPMLLKAVKSFRGTSLYDDFLVELGYDYMISGDDDAAESYFIRALGECPQCNAADNAINWLAIMHLKRGDLVGAAKYSLLLADSIVRTRLSRRGEQRVVDIRNYTIGVQRGNMISGAVMKGDLIGRMIISEVKPGSYAQRLGFKAGDIVTKLNGRTIDGAVSYYAEIAQIQYGDPMRLTVKENIWSDNRVIMAYAGRY